MVRKRVRKKTNQVEESSDNLIRRSEGHMRAGRYKDAIDAYKRLLKKEPGDTWREPLANAYLGRAKSLAAKSMYKEAVVMWEHRAHLGFEEEPQLYIGWLFLAGQQEKALNCYQRLKDSFKRADTDHIESILACRLLAVNANSLNGLTEEASSVRQYSHSKAVISAYCQGDDEQLSSLLKAISYRSPYRDFRTIVSALILLPDQSQAALTMLDRLSTDTPFQGFADLVRLIASKDIKKLHQLKPASQQFVTKVKGIDPQLVPLLNKLNRDAKSPKSLFGHLLNSSKIIDKKQLQPLCQSLLIAYPAGIKPYNRHFEPLSDFATARIHALTAEQQDNLDRAIDYWQLACRALHKTRQPNKNNSRLFLQMALILRHTAELCEQVYGPNNPDIESPLLDSLEYDPDDKPTYLKLFAFYQAEDDTNAYRKILERAVKQFPDETDILLMAVELAIKRNTFRKATLLASKILKKDPINMRVRTLLIEAHLAHACKQVAGGRLDLAEKEIEAAQAMERHGFETGLVNIYRALLADKQGDSEENKRQMEQACNCLGERLGYFRILIEAERFGLPATRLKPYQKLLKQAYKAAPIKADLLNLLQSVQKYKASDPQVANQALNHLQAYLKKAAQLDYSKDEMEMICESWKKTEHFTHLHNYAKEARKTWPNEPVFMYYQVYALSEGGSRALNPYETNILIKAVELLRETEKPELIKSILQLIGPFSFLNMLEDHFEDEGDDDEDDDRPFFPFPF